MTTHLPVVSVSQMRSFNRCRREHQFRYGLGYRAVATVLALRFGTLMHKGLEVWWLSSGVNGGDSQLAYALAAIRAVGEPDAFELVKAEELMRGYHHRWIDDPIEVLAVEREFRAPLLNPETGAASRTYELGGRIDAIARIGQHPERSPGVYAVEHKTTSEDVGLGSVYWQQLRLDSQVSVYFDGAKALGHDPIGCLYDVIKKPTIRPYKATPAESRKYTKDGRLYAAQRDTDETPEEFRERLRADIAENPDKYYQRGTVVRLEEEMRDAAFDTWQTARNIREAELANRHPRNTDQCKRYGRMCEFWPVCSGETNLDSAAYRKLPNVHEELTT